MFESKEDETGYIQAALIGDRELKLHLVLTEMGRLTPGPLRGEWYGFQQL